MFFTQPNPFIKLNNNPFINDDSDNEEAEEEVQED